MRFHHLLSECCERKDIFLDKRTWKGWGESHVKMSYSLRTGLPWNGNPILHMLQDRGRGKRTALSVDSDADTVKVWGPCTHKPGFVKDDEPPPCRSNHTERGLTIFKWNKYFDWLFADPFDGITNINV